MRSLMSLETYCEVAIFLDFQKQEVESNFIGFARNVTTAKEEVSATLYSSVFTHTTHTENSKIYVNLIVCFNVSERCFDGGTE